MSFTEPATSTAMTLRIIRLGTFDGSPVAGPDPTFWLSAGGPATPTSPLPGKASVLNQNDAIVASAGYAVETFDVYRVDITLQHPGSAWTLQIENNESQQRRFTAVVAGTDDEAKQPWINAPSTLMFNVPQGSTQLASGDVLVVNYGTGPLTIQPTGLADPFTVLPPEDITPNGSGHLVVQYDPTKAGSTQQSLAIDSNDEQAGTAAGHNHVIAISFQHDSPPPPPPPATTRPCQFNEGFEGGDVCTDYLPPAAGSEGPCRRAKCGHTGQFHPPQNV